VKAKVEIPEGWRRLRWGEPVRLTDLFLDAERMEWRALGEHWEFEEGDTVQANEIIIRRVAKPAKKK